MKKKILVAALFSAITSGAIAQSKFDGFYGQIGVGYESIQPSFSNSNITISGVGSAPIGSSISNSNGFTGVVTAGFMKTVTKDFLLGIGAEYSPIAGQKANYSASIGGVSLGNGEYNKQNSYNIFITPATPVGQDGLLYGKVGYTGASIKDSFAGSSTTTNYTGYSLGLGYKQIIQGGLYAFAEGNYMSYGSKTSTASSQYAGYTITATNTSSANAYNLLIGIGYKF